MRKSIVGVMVFILGGFLLYAEPLSVIPVEVGMNEVLVKIHNKLDMNLKSVFLELKEGALAEGITASIDFQRLNVSARSISDSGLVLRIEVAENVDKGIYEIPMVIQDDDRHVWSFTLKLQLVSSKPDRYELSQNYPNPFNGFTEIQYALANEKEQETRLVVYNLLGQAIRTLVCGKQAPGYYRMIWDGKDEGGREVGSGVYFYKLVSGSFVQIRRMTLVK